MLNVKPFLIRFAKSTVQESAKPGNGLHEEGNMPDPPPPPDTISTRVLGETTDDN